jgi:ketosteroid isomerase-like protein
MSLTDVERRLQALEDIEAIKKLKARYCLTVDQRDEEGFVSLFTEDAVWDGGRFGHYEGREAIRKFFCAIPDVLTFAVHYVMNPIIEVQGDRATGQWYLLEPCTMVEGNQAVWGTARYEEEYVRVGNEWRFKNLKLIPVFWSPFDQGWVKKQFVGE